ncbi:MAG: hypothetical protein IT349_21855 [Candidatus Eisenbacteria bacterium]|nr:hypothetical protein [Candidatus Eisenbacteria bacterium]
MLDQIHPIVVHFPIALLTTGVALDLLRRRFGPPEATWAIDWVVAIGALGAIAAAASGDASLAGLHLEDAPRRAAEAHEQAGSVAAWCAAAALLLRTCARLSAVPRRGTVASPQAQARWRFVATVAGVLAAILVLRAGYLGGHLVHDLGVTRSTVPERTMTTPPSPERYEAD